MKTKIPQLAASFAAICLVVSLTALPTAAHWDESQPYKWLQMPDLSPFGMDVRATEPYILADDFECNVTGPITEIHIWGSWYKDILPEENAGKVTFILSIHKDIPAGTGGIAHSRPGQVLWYRTFQPGSFTFRAYATKLQEGWMDPPSQYDPLGDTVCWQYNFTLGPEEFIQTGTPEEPIIYWLDVQAIPQYPDAVFGWKTRDPNPSNPGGGHFNDDATWGEGMEPFLGPWYELRYPPGHELNGHSIDLAFVITGEDQLPKHDLGDAPDSTNNVGVAMTAYPAGGPPGVQANFPTVFQTGSPPYGPIHRQPMALAYLGNSVTLEDEADIGPDQDPTNNIIPFTDSPDKDLGDDGVTVPLALPHCQQTQFAYTVTVTNTLTQPLYVNAWFDWNRDGDWDDVTQCPTGLIADEWAVQNQMIPSGTMPGTITLTTPSFVPYHPMADPTEIWMRITLSEQQWQPGAMPGYGGSGPSAGYLYGETEDYYFMPTVLEEFDWGDAPDPGYPTLSSSNGARHAISPLFLGALIDAEPDGQPSANADGDDLNNLDDEDGVVFVSPLIVGKWARVDVTASGPGYLSAWIDWNADGDWDDYNEQIFFSAPVNAGTQPMIFQVAGNPGTTTFARFRLSSAHGLTPRGAAPDGEVEDYKIRIQPEKPSKWYQAPDLSPMGVDVFAEEPLILADDFECTESGPITKIRIWGSWYKDQSPPMSAMPIIKLSIHEDIPAGAGGIPYSRPGKVLWLQTFTEGIGPGQYITGPWQSNLQEGWFNPKTNFYDPFGDTICWRVDFRIPYDKAFIQQGTPEQPKIYWLDMQAIDMTGNNEYYQFGWKTRDPNPQNPGGGHFMDDAVWGTGQEPFLGPWYELRYPEGHELWEQSMDLAFELWSDDLDMGDAPDPTYPTLLASNGASHEIVPGICLGATVDRDPDGQPHPNALGDDNDPEGDDEDGVKWLTPLVPGAPAKVEVTASVPGGYLTAWIDFNGDGDWDEMDEYLASWYLNAGPNVIPFWVPATAAGGRNTFARFRFSIASGGIGYAGHALDGEVEDHEVYIHPNASVVTKGAAKRLPLGSLVRIIQNPVTANFGALSSSDELWYFEEPDRSAGIGILRDNSLGAVPWNVDDVVSCYGTTMVSGCELVLREIYSWLDTPPPPGPGSIKPVGQNNRSSGGGPIYETPLVPPPTVVNQPGLCDIVSAVGTAQPAYGQNTVALLVKLWGKCTYIETSGGTQVNFWIDDGSNLQDGTIDGTGAPVKGVKVKVPSGVTIQNDKYYAAVGIMRTDTASSGECVRWLWPRDANDILCVNCP